MLLTRGSVPRPEKGKQVTLTFGACYSVWVVDGRRAGLLRGGVP